MIYPKNKTNAGAGGKSEAGSRKYLNGQQKEELRKVLAERLSKKYGLKYSDLINDEVSNFMNQQKNITAGALQDLENNIKNATQPKNIGRDNYEKDDDEKSVKSGISKMSGASNFDKVDVYTKKALAKQETQEIKNDKKLQTLNVKKPENDLDFLEEENEWAAIYKYNRFLFEKEEDLKKQKLKEQKIKMKDELDRQIQEREEKKQKEKDEAEKFAQNLQIQLQRYDERENHKNMTVAQIRQAEKEARERQIRDNKLRRRHEVKEEKALDNFLMQKVREELESEAKYLEFKKTHQKEVMEKLLEENEERRKKLKEEEEKERQENIALMNAYAKLITDQEEERERTLQERDRKIKEFQQKALEVVKQENEDKLGWMEKRREKYEARHEKKLQQEEEAKKNQEKQQKNDIKDYLFKQIDEKNSKKAQDKQEYNSQAEIWKKDNEKFQEFEARKTAQKQQIMKQYFNQITEQLKQNEQNKKQSSAKMSENEALLNKHLIEELEKLKNK